MKITVYGASNQTINPLFISNVEDLCFSLAQNGHSLVFGAGNFGLMGAAARGFKKGNANIHGIVPKFFKKTKLEILYQSCNKVTYTKNMAQRKLLMENYCDAFIICPGGIGTFEEFFEALTLKKLGQINKPIILYNIYNYYDKLIEFLDYSYQEKFNQIEIKNLFAVLSSKEEVIEYLNNYKPQENNWHIFAQGDNPYTK